VHDVIGDEFRFCVNQILRFLFNLCHRLLLFNQFFLERVEHFVRVEHHAGYIKRIF
jgi:hypothetical protein